MVLSLGGDGTFLRAASAIRTPNLPIFGINTDPSRSIGAMAACAVKNEDHLNTVVKYLNQNDPLEFITRKRINYMP